MFIRFQIEPLDGSHRLSPPPPLHRRTQRTVQESQAHRRNCSDDSNTATIGSENVGVSSQINHI